MRDRGAGCRRGRRRCSPRADRRRRLHRRIMAHWPGIPPRFTLLYPEHRGCTGIYARPSHRLALPRCRRTRTRPHLHRRCHARTVHGRRHRLHCQLAVVLCSRTRQRRAEVFTRSFHGAQPHPGTLRWCMAECAGWLRHFVRVHWLCHRSTCYVRELLWLANSVAILEKYDAETAGSSTRSSRPQPSPSCSPTSSLSSSESSGHPRSCRFLRYRRSRTPGTPTRLAQARRER